MRLRKAVRRGSTGFALDDEFPELKEYLNKRSFSASHDSCQSRQEQNSASQEEQHRASQEEQHRASQEEQHRASHIVSPQLEKRVVYEFMTMRIKRKRDEDDKVKVLTKALREAKYRVGELRAQVAHLIEDENEDHDAAKECKDALSVSQKELQDEVQHALAMISSLTLSVSLPDSGVDHARRALDEGEMQKP